MSLRIPPVAKMGEETLMKHLELRHDNDVRMKFIPEPDRETRRLNDPQVWRSYHQTMHRLNPASYDHEHNED